MKNCKNFGDKAYFFHKTSIADLISIDNDRYCFLNMEQDAMAICRVDTISIPVSDQNQALQFYRDVLGFELIRDHADNQHTRWVQLVPKGAETTISLVKPFAGMEAGGVQGLVVQTHDIQLTYQELSGKGVALSEIITMMEGRFATFNDPDGNGWVLIQSTATMLA